MTGVIVGTVDGMFGVGDFEVEELRGHATTWIERGADAWWALLDGSRVFRHQPGGEGRLVTQLTDERANCLLPTASGLLIGAARASLFEYDGDDLRRREEFDDAPGRDDWFTPWGGPPDVRSLAQDVDGSVYANVHVGGVLAYRASDPVWRDTMDIHADVHQVIAHPDRAGVALVASARGLGVSTDGAGSWDFRNKGMHADYCRAVAVSGDRVYVSASLGSQGRDAAVYRGELGGGELEMMTGGLPQWFSTNVNTGCLDAAGDVVVIGDADGTLFLSEDGGDSFAVLAEGLPAISCVRLVV